jgi:SAM-dependent methyltransferase
MRQMEFDEQTAKAIEALYLIRDAERRRAIVRSTLGAAPGERILDVGCGPGFYCAELLEDVTPSGAVVGVDGSAAMLALAARRLAGRDNAELLEADALALPVADESFDAVLSVQVQEYVPDVAAALGELHRALRPGGRALVWDVDWATLSINTTDQARMDRILGAWDEHLAHPTLPRTLAARLRSAGFKDVQVAGHAFVTVVLDGETYGGAIVPFIADFVPGHGGVTEDEAQTWLAEQRELGERGEFSFAVTQFCFTARKPG